MEAHIQQHQNIVLDHYRMVESVARHIHSRLPSSVQLDDLVSVGTLGLIESIDRFDASRGVPFESFARHRVRGAILDALRAADWVPHSVRRKAQAIDRTRRSLAKRGRATDDQRVAAAMGLPVERYRSMTQDAEIRQVLSLDAPAANGTSPLLDTVGGDEDLQADTETAELRSLLRAAVQRLPAREQRAIELYYFRGLQLKEVGAQLGVTESRACQLCGQGIKRLRKRLAHAI